MWESLSWEVMYCGMSLPWERNANNQTGIRGKKEEFFFFKQSPKGTEMQINPNL